MGYTAETAEYFQLFHVTSRLEKFEAELQQRKEADGDVDPGSVKELFPFTEFFKNAPAGEALFPGKDLEHDLEVARGCFRHIDKVLTFDKKKMQPIIVLAFFFLSLFPTLSCCFIVVWEER